MRHVLHQTGLHQTGHAKQSELSLDILRPPVQAHTCDIQAQIRRVSSSPGLNFLRHATMDQTISRQTQHGQFWKGHPGSDRTATASDWTALDQTSQPLGQGSQVWSPHQTPPSKQTTLFSLFLLLELVRNCFELKGLLFEYNLKLRVKTMIPIADVMQNCLFSLGKPL